jgi:hypothetical protein
MLTSYPSLLNFTYLELPLNKLQAGFHVEEINKRALDAKSRYLRRLSLLKLI